MSLIVGVDDFGDACDRHLNFIDKSLFIKEILDHTHLKAIVIIRPRRFGKTFNMSMLHHFFASEVNGLKTAAMFTDLKIAQAGDVYMKEQGQYPVIFISFKSLKKQAFDAAYAQLAELMSQTYQYHDYLLSSTQLKDYEKREVERILTKEDIDINLLENSLSKLSYYLFKHHGVKPWLLMDEYDTPIQSAYLFDYYQPMMDLMRGLFGNALKGNPNIHRVVITGILRIAKENLFSGVNNLDVYSILNSEYAEYFGFTQEEIDVTLEAQGLTHLAKEIKYWYNGYHIGNCQIYNPWSIANCLNRAGTIQPYWVNTSDNLLIKQTLAQAGVNVKEKLESILAGQPIQAEVNENTIFSDLDGDGESVWGLLLFSGYLTAIESQREGLKNLCKLIPPNQEVASLYPDVVTSWFLEKLGENSYSWLLKSIAAGDMDTFLKILKKFLRESSSYFDMSGTQPEKFYHGFVLGLMVGLHKTHQIYSNKESGYGRYDVMLIPNDKTQLGLILEFKIADEDEALQKTAEDALAQINARHYATQLQQQGISHILKIGLGFRGKEVALTSSS